MRINAGDLASLLEVDLQQAGWNGAKNPYPGQTQRQYAMMALSKSFVKKTISRRTTEAADKAALDLFESVNERCRAYKFCTDGLPSWTRTALGEAKSFIYELFYSLSDGPDTEKCWGLMEKQHLTYASICEGFGVGPGSSLGAPETDFYSKLSLSTMAASSSTLHKLYVQAISNNPTWTAMESLRSQRFGSEVVESSRLSFVPKTREISRTICTEPVLNMMFQKGIAKVLEKRLRETMNIDLSLQPDRNRRLARVGSLTGEFGTIDLSSASDSMSLALVREFFPATVVQWLERTSCRSTILPGGRKLELHMISSMGNAFTFPLQTIFFCSLVYGAYKSLGIPIKRPGARTDGNFAVFGDDIIVCKRAYGFVCELLSISGFSVNVDKSFNEGLFRESCGHDYYYGLDVRGVYVKTLDDMHDCYSTINRLNRWSAKHDVFLPRTVGYLRSRVRYLPVPYDEDDSHGIKVPSRLLDGRVFRDEDTGAIIYRFLTPRKRQYSMHATDGRKGKSSSEKPRGFYENPDGQMLALLVGSIRGGRVSLRTISRTSVVKKRSTPRWDWIASGWEVTPGFVSRWKAAVEMNV